MASREGDSVWVVSVRTEPYQGLGDIAACETNQAPYDVNRVEAKSHCDGLRGSRRSDITDPASLGTGKTLPGDTRPMGGGAGANRGPCRRRAPRSIIRPRNCGACMVVDLGRRTRVCRRAACLPKSRSMTNHVRRSDRLNLQRIVKGRPHKASPLPIYMVMMSGVG